MASAFKTAFAAARKAGKKEFTFEGKNYNTELKETARPKARGTSVSTGPRPKARPVSADAGKGPSGADMSTPPKKRTKGESAGRAHIGRNRPAGLSRRGQ